MFRNKQSLPKQVTYIFLSVFLMLSMAFDDNGALQNNVLFTSAFNTISRLEPKPSGEFHKLTIPFKRAGNLIMLEATIDDQTGYFILDTGAPYLVLNNTYFRDYPQLELYASVGTTGVGKSTFKTKVEFLKIRSLNYNRLQADVTDLSEIENVRKVKVLGLLGIGLFKHLVFKIDYTHNNIQFFDPDQFQAFADYKRHPFKMKNNVISVNGSVNGEKLQFAIDTGAELNAISSNLSENVDALFNINNRKRLSGVGESVEVFTGEFKHIDIDEVSYLNMKTVMIDLEPISYAYGFRVDGILGYEWLAKKGSVIFNVPEKEIYLKR